MSRRNRPCHYCGIGMTKRGTRDKRSATRDHIIPKSRGGTGSPINTIMCCRKCNNEKGDFTGVEYREWIRAGRPPNREAFYMTGDTLNSEPGSNLEWFTKLYIGKQRLRGFFEQLTPDQQAAALKYDGPDT